MDMHRSLLDRKSKRKPRLHRADPITAELVRTSLIAATEEMKSVLMRTSYNMIIYEALDFTVGLFDRKGQTLSIGLGLPMFIRGMSDVVIAKIKHFGYDGIEPDDILLTNDAYADKPLLNRLHSGEAFGDGGLVGAMFWALSLIMLTISGLIVYYTMRGKRELTGINKIFW